MDKVTLTPELLEHWQRVVSPGEAEVVFLSLIGVLDSKDGFGVVTVHIKNRKIDHIETTVSLKPRETGESPCIL